MSFPIKNEAMDDFINQRKTVIYNSLCLLNEKLKGRLDEIFTNREIEPLNKLKISIACNT